MRCVSLARSQSETASRSRFSSWATVPASFDGKGNCFIETGDSKAGYGKGDFYAEPLPQVKIQTPGRRWHAAKVLFERDWLRRWV